MFLHTHIHALGCHFPSAGWLSHGLLGLRMRSWEPGGAGEREEERATGGSRPQPALLLPAASPRTAGWASRHGAGEHAL